MILILVAFFSNKGIAAESATDMPAIVVGEPFGDDKGPSVVLETHELRTGNVRPTSSLKIPFEAGICVNNRLSSSFYITDSSCTELLELKLVAKKNGNLLITQDAAARHRIGTGGQSTGNLAVSPDGKHVVYANWQNSAEVAYVCSNGRNLTQVQQTRLRVPGTAIVSSTDFMPYVTPVTFDATGRFFYVLVIDANPPVVAALVPPLAGLTVDCTILQYSVGANGCLEPLNPPEVHISTPTVFNSLFADPNKALVYLAGGLYIQALAVRSNGQLEKLSGLASAADSTDDPSNMKSFISNKDNLLMGTMRGIRCFGFGDNGRILVTSGGDNASEVDLWRTRTSDVPELLKRYSITDGIVVPFVPATTVDGALSQVNRSAVLPRMFVNQIDNDMLLVDYKVKGDGTLQRTISHFRINPNGSLENGTNVYLPNILKNSYISSIEVEP